MADDFSFSIEQSLGLVTEGKGGWNLELNLVSWGGRPAKYDLRSWSPDHQKMGKGLTLTKEELIALKDLLNKIEL
ncbi:MAG: YdbC family protein [Treponema sp.]|nr:YdbC family protein [Treponema sp.]